jgi:HEPN domain-containing protein
MKLETREWIAKADGDFYDAQRGVRARKHPNHDGVCSHAQQCIEKYFKARLVEAGIAFPKTHDLVRLLDLVAPAEASWELWRPELDVLTDYAVAFRYPAESATKKEAHRAFAICKRLRVQIRHGFGLRELRQGPQRRRRTPPARSS